MTGIESILALVVGTVVSAIVVLCSKYAWLLKYLSNHSRGYVIMLTASYLVRR